MRPGSKARIVALLAALDAGWLAFDGLHAIVTGDYVTPGSGPHAGQLGPWSTLIAGIGLDPRSLTIQALHLCLGAFGLAAAAFYLRRWEVRSAWAAMLAFSVLTLWYLPFGTALSLVQIGLLTRASLRPRTS